MEIRDRKRVIFFVRIGLILATIGFMKRASSNPKRYQTRLNGFRTTGAKNPRAISTAAAITQEALALPDVP